MKFREYTGIANALLITCVLVIQQIRAVWITEYFSLDLRKKLRVMFVNSQGLTEPGIDGGGVFREFLSDVLKTGFDPNRGYFSTTPDGQLYPNPQVQSAPM